MGELTLEEIISQWRRGSITAGEAIGAMMEDNEMFANALMKAIAAGQRLD